MWSSLGDKLNNALKNKFSKINLTHNDIQQGIRLIRMALLEADVHLKIVKKFTSELEKKLEGQVKLGSLNPYETIVKIVYDELVSILGEKEQNLKLKKRPGIIMFVGLQGTGKTTSVAKLALYLRKKRKKKCLLVAGDIYRPAAIEQLVELGKQLQIDVLEKGKQNKVEDVCAYALDIAKKYQYDTVIIDTAGRLTLNEELMNELVNIKKRINPDEILLTIDATSGQDVLTAAEQFHSQLNITGAIISKMDYDAKGGAAFSLVSLLGIPIKFIGVGEKPKDFELFYPTRMAKRILDYGDIETLSERAKEIIDEKVAKKTVHKIMSGKFDLNDFLQQMKQIKKLDKISGILKMLPAFRKMNISDNMLSNIDEKLKVFETLIYAMTIEERKNPKLLKQASRKARILAGSGRSAQEFNLMIGNWEKAQIQMQQLHKSRQLGKKR